ncbi:MAG TPA: serine protease [Bacteroidales bacterium]|nr:MAG: peptidase S46 [Bacteroidetes bacterium GWF2_33_38]OFY90931.1 MAG: peptidase S46 [Bacteroidetes bacterium RIFOXYA2_FULL_33_7]HBF88641.1 serine protease [Bacteroidales bacterium]
MINKVLSSIIVFILLFNVSAKADEGMWIPMLLDKKYDEMKKLGLKLTAEDLYSINHSSLKDAIIQFGNGCTGEIISAEGLILTNHHCGYGQIQSHSSVEHDYLTDGFWAMTRAEELPNDGLVAKFLVRIEDVTAQILPSLSDTLSERERARKIHEISLEIEKKSVEGTHYNAVVKDFFDGNQYFVYIYEIFKDVRLVGAPPSSIGKFGGDTDNWMWPRHTGDFSMFRVYMAPDGSPAEYSSQNIPYKPKHHLPVKLSGVKKDDYAMIMGYPGRTNRYLSSQGVQDAIDSQNPTVVKIRDKKLEILREKMNNSDEIRIKYASKYARTSNYWKYFIGQTKQLKNNHVFDKKKALEDEFSSWILSDENRKQKYGNVLAELDETYKSLKDFNVLRKYSTEAALTGVDLLDFADYFRTLYIALKDNKTDKIEEQKAFLLSMLDNFYKDYDLETDKLIFKNLLEMFYKDIPETSHPSIFSTIKSKYKGDFEKFTNYAYSKTIFTNKDDVKAFLANPCIKTLDKDEIFSTMKSISNKLGEESKKSMVFIEKQEKAKRLFMEGLMEMKNDVFFYPNANSSMRLTYGTVQNYEPRDAVYYNYFTTIDGIMQKDDASNYDFNVPAKLKQLYETKDYGQYGEDGTLKVCFLTNNDITGGNSGSPVIGANGELIGLAFDGNWEAMSGDISFEPSVQRTICVDIRYVLFIVDKFAGAKHLVDEMTVFKE